MLDHVRTHLQEKIAFWILGVSIILLIPILYLSHNMIEQRVASVNTEDALLYITVTDSSEISYQPGQLQAMLGYYTKECIMFGFYSGLGIAFILLLLAYGQSRRSRRKFVEALLPEKDQTKSGGQSELSEKQDDNP
ncbi:hypothetical protein [Sedimentisphaera salicampi]|uniref:Uncharacterized protein n=1 Tax=Sedimentisphaera salicampi TaxID=1941349 RepID=A0A1W6LPA0_9BACT|nr:hypothetical protein [Sedimentisphaera salicampi]ARN57618.1 hypothetical protein STSP1_02039 [Sedimentisphaera salicampi]OXU14186.1 hypothetical protein SMSP1_01952 [Sedimentisphaera salicampi]